MQGGSGHTVRDHTDRAVPQLLSSATMSHRGNGNEMLKSGPPLFNNASDLGAETRDADVQVPGGVPTTSGAGEGPAGMPHMVPQLKASPLSQQALPRGLTKAQQSELEMARRRAQKAAEGKAANAAVSRRVKRKSHDEDEDDDMSHMQNEEIEAKLASITDVKEAKRLKRLLRNRVSAQQARERKKSYVSNLEQRAREQEQSITEMEQRVNKLERENAMLRSVMKNMKAPAAPSAYGSMQQGSYGGVPQAQPGGHGAQQNTFGF